MKAKSLADLVFRHYLRSALLPVLTVELVLVAVYFAVNAWNTRQTAGTMRDEVRQILPHFAHQEAALLQDGFARISREATLFAREHEALLADPDAFAVRGEEPRFARAANGSLYQANRRDGSGLFYSANAKVGPYQEKIARRTAALDPHYRHVVEDVPNVVASYYNSADNMNRLYPYIEKVWEQYPASLSMVDYNFYYLADAAHDPERRTVWTGAYLDPAGHGWMVSCVSPVYRRDTLQGVVGLDVTIDRIVENLLGQKLPWNASAFLVDDSGMILAMPAPVEDLFGLKELKEHVYKAAVSTETLKPKEFNLLANPDRGLAGRFKAILDSSKEMVSINVRGRETFLVQRRIPETGWRVFLVARSEDVFQSVEDVARRAKMVGWFVVAGMLLFYAVFFAYLRRNAKAMSTRISEPITSLARATSELGKDFGRGRDLALSGIPEIDRLTENYNTLSGELEQRSQELVRSGVREQLQQKEAELAFARGQYESASAYLHNVGNLAVRLGSCAIDLEEIAATADQYPEVFRRLRDRNDPALVDRFEEVLLGKVVPRLKAGSRELSEVRNSIHNAIEHQQRAFLEGREQLEAEEFDLSESVMEACDGFAKWAARGRVEIVRSIEPGIRVRNHRYQIKDGLVNGFKNALESIGTGPGRIEVRVGRNAGGRAVVAISDDGPGLAPEIRSKLLTAGFTTKPWGHGLGLHSLAVFLASHNGRLDLESPGEGKGAVLTLEVGDV
jgi:C4-dicarboxylate-specific signal transduction histidine kinase